MVVVGSESRPLGQIIENFCYSRDHIFVSIYFKLGLFHADSMQQSFTKVPYDKVLAFLEETGLFWKF